MISDLYDRAGAWVLAVDIQVNPTPPPGSNKILTLVSWGGWLAALAALAALIAVGGKFGWEKKHGTADSESAERAAKACGGCVLISIAGALVGALTG